MSKGSIPESSVPESSAKQGAGLLRTVPLLMLVVACAQFNRTAIAVAGAERIIPMHGVSEERMGLIYSAFLAFYTLAMLPGGWFIDRFGSRMALFLLCLGSTLFVGLTGSTALAGDGTSLWLALLLVRSILGLVNAPLHPAAAHMVFQQVPRPSRAFANGLVTFAACVGIASTFTVFGSLIDWLDWPLAFVVMGGVTALVTLVWVVGTRPSAVAHDVATPRPRGATDFRELFYVLRRPSIVCLSLSYGAQGYFQYLFFYWIGYYFDTIQKMGKVGELQGLVRTILDWLGHYFGRIEFIEEMSVARFNSTLILLAMGVGMVCGGWLTDRVPHSLSLRVRRALVPVICMIASGLVFELGLLTSNPQGTLAAFALAAALIGACEGAFWTTAVELGGKHGGAAAGLLNTVGNAGGTLSPVLTPVLGGIFAAHYGDQMGWRLSLAVAGVILIIGAGLWWGVRPEEPEAAKTA